MIQIDVSTVTLLKLLQRDINKNIALNIKLLFCRIFTY